MIYNDEECIEFYNQNLKGKRLCAYSQNMQKNYPDFINYILNRFNDLTKKEKLIELIYRLEHKIEEIPKCPICGKPLKFINKDIPSYQTFCSKKCMLTTEGHDILMNKTIKTNLEKYGCKNQMQNSIIKQKIQQTCLKKYGCKSYLQSQELREKSKQTCLKKYGCEYPSQNIEIKEKVKQTCFEKYGCEHIFQNENIKNKIKKTNLEKYSYEYATQNEEVHKKMINTNLEKYGHEYSSQNSIVKQKVKKTNLEKYGVEIITQNKKIREKINKTNLEKYGCICALHNNKIHDKVIKTNLEKYGCEYPMQNKEIMLKSFKNRYDVNKSYKFSKKENEIYDYLIIIDKDTKRQYYSELYPFHCDFYLPKYDLYIEYQGMWTHGKHPFNKNDIELLETWKKKAEKSNFYKKAIYTWTISDPLKRKTAQENNLKYLEIFSGDSYKDIINSYLKI